MVKITDNFKKITQIVQFAKYGQLASGILHDLANPLTALTLSIESLKKNHQRSANKDNMMETQRQLEQVTEVIGEMRDLLATFQQQIKQQEIKRQFCLVTEINRVVKMLKYMAKENKVTIKFKQRTTNQGRFMFIGNPIKFSQLVANLISNAIDAYDTYNNQQTDNGRERLVYVDLSKSLSQKQPLLKHNKNKESYILEVKDSGRGIEESVLKNIFKPLFTTKTINQGTGLGLSLCKRIVEEDFDGKISVRSKIGQGSIFKIVLMSKNLE